MLACPPARRLPRPPVPHCPRLDLWWRPLPVVMLPLASFLVKDGSGRWALVDAGAVDSWSQSYASRLTAAVKAALPRGASLDVILREWAGPASPGAPGACLRIRAWGFALREARLLPAGALRARQPRGNRLLEGLGRQQAAAVTAGTGRGTGGPRRGECLAS